jgi:glycosyltransferase involved in cell wall biosynthesis
MKTQKLLFYTHGLVDGGAERLWSSLASEFQRRGHTVIFAEDFEAHDSRNLLDARIPIITLGKGHLRSIRALAALLKQERPDVALSAVAGSNLKLIVASLISRANTKCIISYHGYEEWKSGLLSFLTFLGLPFLSVLSKRTVAVSNGLRRNLIRTWGADAARTVAIHNPVYLPPAIPAASEVELNARDDIVLAVGRLTAVKGLDTLIRAFARLKRTSARLIILGKGPEEKRLQRLIRDLGLQGRVDLAGYQPEPWPHYRHAKCLALSSQSEQFGNVIVEALAHGLPVVATNCTGPREILDEGRYGEIVPIGDADALAAAIDRALEAPGNPEPRRDRARSFSFAARVPHYVNLIEEVVGSTPGVDRHGNIAGSEVGKTMSKSMVEAP